MQFCDVVSETPSYTLLKKCKGMQKKPIYNSKKQVLTPLPNQTKMTMRDSKLTYNP